MAELLAYYNTTRDCRAEHLCTDTEIPNATLPVPSTIHTVSSPHELRNAANTSMVTNALSWTSLGHVCSLMGH